MTDIKQCILSRRARFIAAAVAGLSLTPGCDSEPQACLDMAPPFDAGGDGASDASSEPGACLKIQYDSGMEEEAEPQVCLKAAPDDASLEG